MTAGDTLNVVDIQIREDFNNDIMILAILDNSDNTQVYEGSIKSYFDDFDQKLKHKVMEVLTNERNLLQIIAVIVSLFFLVDLVLR